VPQRQNLISATIPSSDPDHSGLPDREPLKKPRDLEQARAVAKLVVDEMPHLPFENTLTSLQGDVRR